MALRIGRSRIPDWLARKGKSQVDLAEYLKVTEAHISQVINGKSNLSKIKLKMTADYFGCHIDDLDEWIYD